MSFEAPLLAALSARLVGAEVEVDESFIEWVVTIEPERLREALQILREDEAFGFEVLTDLTAVDRAPARPRFELVYRLHAAAAGHGLCVRSYLREGACEAQSVVALWPAANWLEREVWDLYGIHFVGHPDLRRLFLDESFVGHPLRKDHPVGAGAPARAGEST